MWPRAKGNMTQIKLLASYLQEFPRLVWDLNREEDDEVFHVIFALAPAGRRAGAPGFKRSGDQTPVGHSSFVGAIKRQGKLRQTRARRVRGTRCASSCQLSLVLPTPTRPPPRAGREGPSRAAVGTLNAACCGCMKPAETDAFRSQGPLERKNRRHFGEATPPR